MDQFFHIRMLVSMIVSLSMAQLLKGIAKIIEHPKRKAIYWVHLLWVLYVFILLIYFWWWEFNLRKIEHWNFGVYCFIILYIVLFYLICSVIFPEDLNEYASYKDYFYKRKNWFFILLASIFLIDMGDTLLKGKAYFNSLGIEYPIRNIMHVLLCVFAIITKKEWHHKILVTLMLAYGIAWILRKYFFE